VLPRTSLGVGYFWRWFQGFLVTDNLATATIEAFIQSSAWLLPTSSTRESYSLPGDLVTFVVHHGGRA
jgi:hypothetical protein